MPGDRPPSAAATAIPESRQQKPAPGVTSSNETLLAPRGNRDPIESDFCQDLIGVSADFRNRSHHCLNTLDVRRRNQSGEFSYGRIDIVPSIPRSKLRMVEELLHRVHARIGNLRLFESLNN